MERETLEVDVLIVGAGPAGLSAALRLQRLIADHNRHVSEGQKSGKKLSEISILVLEKGAEIGSHIISGAILDPRALRELIPDFEAEGAPLDCEVASEGVFYLAKKHKIPLPAPPPMKNDGNYIISLNRFVRWMGKLAERRGIDVMPRFPAREPLLEAGRVVGVRTGDKGIDKSGRRKSNFEPGADIRAKITIFAEGARGSCTKVLLKQFSLDEGRNPQIYSAGVKEVWRIRPENSRPGTVYHTLGFPLFDRAVGGSFIYFMKDNLVSLGLVVGLDYEDPWLDPHEEFQVFKTHPFVSSILEGATSQDCKDYGAKAIPEGGFFSVPRSYFPGGLLIGDAAGFMNMMKLKGIHLAMKTGMLAAETAFEALQKEDYSAEQLSSFEKTVQESWVHEELWSCRNYRQALGKGLFWGSFHIFLQLLTGGRGIFSRMPTEESHKRMRMLKEFYGATVPEKTARKLKTDHALVFDKVTDVYFSGTIHDEDQPSHLHVLDTNICVTRCKEEYGNPCERFCPAHVYEMVEDPQRGLKLQLNFSNCVHCKTCDIMDPYQIITWVTPEGGGGPNYHHL